MPDELVVVGLAVIHCMNVKTCGDVTGFPHGIESIGKVLNFKIGFQDLEKVLNLDKMYIRY